jgi:N-acetylneuraminic acid mutarotase
MRNYKIYLSLFLIICCKLSDAQWTQVADFTGNPGPFASGFGIGNKAYIIENQCTNRLWEYDVTNDTWLQKAYFPGVCRTSGVAFSVNGKGYFGTGGFNGSNIYENDWWEYDPVINTWTQKTSFPGGARMEAVGFSIANKGYLGTGYSHTGTPVYYKDFWEYDPSTDAWIQKSDVPGPPRDLALGVSLNSKGYLGLGIALGQIGNPSIGNLSDFYEYDPTANTWTQKQSVSFGGRVEAGIFYFNNEIYIMGGRIISSQTGLTSGLKFNPLTNVWSNFSGFDGGAVLFPVAISFSNSAYMGMGMDNFQNNRNDWWKFVLNPTSITEDINDVGDVQIYPSPTTDYLFIKTTKTIVAAEFKLWSVEGSMLLKKQISNTEDKIDLSHLPNGIYVAEWINGGDVVRKKIIKE